MRRNPALTYDGALRLLGHHDRPRLDKLDRLLGGCVLGAGAVALLGPAAAPAALFAAIWGWVDQKNEATRLVRGLLDNASDRLLRTDGYERHELIAAAHTTLVVGSYYEALRQSLGKKTHASLEITDHDRRVLAAGSDRRRLCHDLIEVLYLNEVPAPSADSGFEENVQVVRLWLTEHHSRVVDFIGGLEASRAMPSGWRQAVVGRAVARYRSNYLRMAATVPEFMVWASLGEHAATRDSVKGARKEIVGALRDQAGALARLEAVLSLDGDPARTSGPLGAVVRGANRAVLGESIVPARASGEYWPGLTFPEVGRIHVNPRYRLAVASAQARPADEAWWREQPVHADLDLRLATYLTSPDAARLPLLLLGHPGAGKSLLTKVLAARLPESTFTVVRVALRHVDADAPIYLQIQQALDRETHGRVLWNPLVEESLPTVRVVLLDGLDELLQASTGHNAGYLQNVMEFQRLEAELGRPVAVLVTSRTLVADRAHIPAGTPLIKLEEFSEGQVRTWLAEWHRVNAKAIAEGKVRDLPVEVALKQGDLARQPLLLLMLALYAADPEMPELEAVVSTAELYRRLLENFARREVMRAPTPQPRTVVERAVREHLNRLSIAALAMFNRGRQDVTDVELGADLLALTSDGVAEVREADLGQRVVGQFFFVHTSEARDHPTVTPRRSYEFLHATFGEYLVGSRVLGVLATLAKSPVDDGWGGRVPDDDLLYSLLSHQPLALRRPTLIFAADLFARLPEGDRESILRVLDLLIAGYRRRHAPTRYTRYRPLPVDRVRQLAAYSVNLVLLRVLLDSTTVPLAELWPDSEDPLSEWRATVQLWKAGLESDSWHAVLASLYLTEDSLRVAAYGVPSGTRFEPILHARLLGDHLAKKRLRFGMAIVDREFTGGTWEEEMFSWLVPALAPLKPVESFLDFDPVGLVLREVADPEAVPHVFTMLWMLLKQRAHEMPYGQVKALVQMILRRSPDLWPDPHALVAAILAYPWLLEEIPELVSPTLYAGAPAVPLMLMTGGRNPSPRQAELLKKLSQDVAELSGKTVEADLRNRIRALLNAHRWSPEW